ncbi:MAG: hypothetical protein MRERC_3c034 [Mycoplasmataceae bacterium RC_NB112A]|nr:MAG: hypothetical protein MRERC_3c034 [Mycoplasmataceae bacterium RC_NB112A]
MKTKNSIKTTLFTVSWISITSYFHFGWGVEIIWSSLLALALVLFSYLLIREIFLSY